jgi:hypothetical protein
MRYESDLSLGSLEVDCQKEGKKFATTLLAYSRVDIGLINVVSEFLREIQFWRRSEVVVGLQTHVKMVEVATAKR